MSSLNQSNDEYLATGQIEFITVQVGQAMPIPLYTSNVPAGFPSPANDEIEQHLDLNEYLIPHPAATYFVRAKGHSMQGIGIDDGDLLVVDRSLDPYDGAIVIAAVDSEFTVKRVKLKSKEIWLLPENPNYEPIKVSGESSLEIWGVVKNIVKSL